MSGRGGRSVPFRAEEQEVSPFFAGTKESMPFTSGANRKSAPVHSIAHTARSNPYDQVSLALCPRTVSLPSFSHLHCTLMTAPTPHVPRAAYERSHMHLFSTKPLLSLLRDHKP